MPASPAVPIAIEARTISKSFGGVPALRDVSVMVRRGQMHALLGQNGAGKSTLVKILNGVHPAGTYTGALYLDKLSEVEAYDALWADLDRVALDRAASDDLIAAIIKESDD